MNIITKSGLFFFEKLQEYLYFFTQKLRNTQWIDVHFPPIHLLHLYIIILCIGICIFAYIKLKYPFWNIQPVYHTYDFWRYFYNNPFQIQRNRANNHTKFYQKNKVKTIKYTDLSQNAKNIFIDKLQCYYLLSEDVLFIIKPTQLDIIMNGHIDGPSFVSFYMDTIYKKDISKEEEKEGEKGEEGEKEREKEEEKGEKEFQIKAEELPVAGMASYPISLKYKGKSIITHYWEYIWINRAYKNRNIQRILIQTHDCKVREIHPEIQRSIFKKTDILCEGVVPIVKYNSFVFKTAYQKLEFPKNMFLTRIYNHNNVLYDILENPNVNQLFDIQLYPCISNIQTQIKKEQLYVYCLKQKEQIISIYFFKETFSLCEYNNTRILRLASSICNSRNTYIHVIGYMCSIRNILKHVPTKYGVSVIDDLAHNSIIIKYLKLSKENATENAYYSYNYVIPKTPVNPQRVFVIL